MGEELKQTIVSFYARVRSFHHTCLVIFFKVALELQFTLRLVMAIFSVIDYFVGYFGALFS